MELNNIMTNTSETPRTDAVPHNVAELAMLDDLLWRLSDIRDDLMSTGLGGRLYNCDEWSTPTVNLASAIKVIEKFKSNSRT